MRSGGSLRVLHHFLPCPFGDTSGMPEHRQTGSPGKCLLEQGEALGDQLRAKTGQSSDIPARPGETRDESVADWVLHRWHDDRNRGGRLPCGTGRRRTERDDDVDPESDQFGRESRIPLDPSLC
jgi:hypothetical protein